MANEYDISPEIESIENEKPLFGKKMRVYLAGAFKKIQKALGSIPGIVERWENAEIGDVDKVLEGMQGQINTANTNITKAQTSANTAQSTANTAKTSIDNYIEKMAVITNSSSGNNATVTMTGIDSTGACILEFDFACFNATSHAPKYIEINTLTGAYNMAAIIGGALHVKVTLVRNGDGNSWTAQMLMVGKSATEFFSERGLATISSKEITSIRMHTAGTGDTYNNWRYALRRYY